MQRRDFLQKFITGGTALSVSSILGSSLTGCARAGAMPRRKLGQTGEKLSVIGFGGIMLNRMEQSLANNVVAEAYDSGVNYYDVAPSYGNAEEKLGPALESYRDNCFLACKTQKRDRAGAEEELNQSLKNLRTDHFDLYQLHAIRTKEDVETAFGPGGAMETFLKARDEGKVRYLGFSAHSVEAAMLAMDNFDFDTTLFPVNFVCWHEGNFGPQVVERARERDMGILAIKSMARTRIPQGEDRPYERLWYIPIEDDKTAHLSVRYTLSKGVTAAIPPGDADFFRKALTFVDDLEPLSNSEEQVLLDIASDIQPLFSVT